MPDVNSDSKNISNERLVHRPAWEKVAAAIIFSQQLLNLSFAISGIWFAGIFDYWLPVFFLSMTGIFLLPAVGLLLTHDEEDLNYRATALLVLILVQAGTAVAIYFDHSRRVSMDPTIVAAVIGAFATIIAAVIGLIKGRQQGRRREKELWEANLSSAPEMYGKHLGTLIDRASAADSGGGVVVGARAIVTVRNDLRNSLVSLASLLNSDIDRLAAEVASVENEGQGLDRVRETIGVLREKWPAKTSQIEVEIRKILVELGLERRRVDDR